MTKLRKISVLDLAKLHAATIGCVGLVTGMLYSFGGAIYDVVTTGSVNLGTALAFLALIGMPIIFAICGFIAGAIAAPLYNFIADRFGGVEIHFGEGV